jgi:polyvinyl alcohol dehydrogenase (cytochrome)
MNAVPGSAGVAAQTVTGSAGTPTTGTNPDKVGTAGQPVVSGAGGAISQPAAGTTGGAPVPDASDWPMMGYDLGSSYFNTAETVVTKSTAVMLDVAWTADLGGNVYGAPLQVGDKIYASGPGSVHAYDAATGHELWSTNVASTSTLSYVEGTLYLNSQQGQMIAINAVDGKQLWMKTVNDQMTDGSSSAIPAGDLVLVGGSNGYAELSGGGTFRGYLAALKRMTGDVAWTTYTVPDGAKGAAIWSTPSVDLEAGRAFAGTGNNYGLPATDSSDSIIAFDLKTGTIAWKNQRIMNDTFGGGAGPDSDFGANPVLYETLVNGTLTKLIADGAKGGSVHALRREDGAMVWTRSIGTGAADGSSGVFTNFTWAGKNLLVACNQSVGATLYALDGATGDIVWMRTLQGLVWGRTAAVSGVGFVGTGGTLEVFDVDTGVVIKSFQSKGGTLAGGVTIAHGRVAFGEGLSWSSGVIGSTLTVLTIK